MTPHSIILNGEKHPVNDIETISSLLVSLGLSAKPVVVEMDGEVILPADYDNTLLKKDSRVEIVSIVAGG